MFFYMYSAALTVRRGSFNLIRRQKRRILCKHSEAAASTKRPLYSPERIALDAGDICSLPAAGQVFIRPSVR